MKNSHFFVNVILAMTAIAVSVIGCGKTGVSGLVSAEGTLSYNGIPLPWATVALTPKEHAEGDRMATANTDAEGRFVLLTLGQKGALPNTYRVTVHKDIRNTGPKAIEEWKKEREKGNPEIEPVAGEVVDYISALSKKYDSAHKSGIEITIGPQGDRDLKIELKDE